MDNKIIIIMWAVIILASVFIVLGMHFNSKGKQNSAGKKTIEIFNRIYSFFNRVPFISVKFKKIRTKIYNNHLSEEWVIRYKTIEYYLISWLVAIICGIFVIVYFKNNIYVTLALLFFSYQFKEMTLNALIGDDTNLLIAIYNYLEELQQNFTFSKDVRKSIEEANKTATNATVVRHMEKINNILEDDVLFDEYITECPNTFLKLVASNCQLTNEYGDKKDADDKSTFMQNIRYIRQDIETEVFKRKQLKFWLRSLPLMCILPILAFTPFEAWAHNTLKMTDVFYKTSAGFIVKILITFLSIVCFYAIKSFSNTDQAPINIGRNYWEEKILKIKPIRRLFKVLVPRANSPKYYRYRDLISRSGEFTKIEYIYVRKLAFAILGCVLTFSICMSIHHMNYNNILYDQNGKFPNQLIVVGTIQKNSDAIENNLLKYVNPNNQNKSVIILQQKLREMGVSDNAVITSLASKIVNKKIALDNQYFHWYEIFIVIAAGVLCWFIPNWSLKFKAEMRKYEMENEVVIFETIILILMYHDTATSELILSTMYKFSNIFRNPIDKINKDFTKGDLDAIEDTITDMYRPFANLIKNIVKADSIRSCDAFLNLAENRKSYIDIRKENNKRLINKRIGKASLISLLPINLVVMVYIAAGMLYVAFIQLDTTQTQMNQIESQQSVD